MILKQIHQKLDKILLMLSSFDWETLSSLNNNITSTFVSLEDINIKLESMNKEIHTLSVQINEFTTQFNVVEEIQTEHTDDSILGYKDGSDIYRLIDSEKNEKSVTPLSEVPVGELEEAARKRFASVAK